MNWNNKFLSCLTKIVVLLLLIGFRSEDVSFLSYSEWTNITVDPTLQVPPVEQDDWSYPWYISLTLAQPTTQIKKGQMLKGKCRIEFAEVVYYEDSSESKKKVIEGTFEVEVK